MMSRPLAMKVLLMSVAFVTDLREALRDQAVERGAVAFAVLAEVFLGQPFEQEVLGLAQLDHRCCPLRFAGFHGTPTGPT